MSSGWWHETEAAIESRHAETERRIAAVRQAKLEAHRRGYVSPSPEELTAALGDLHGAEARVRRRACRVAYGPRKAARR